MPGEQRCSTSGCQNMVQVRGREEIAAGLRNTIASCAMSPCDWVQRFRSLTAHLWWLEGELLGLCADCILQRAAQIQADAIEEGRLGPDPLPSNVVRMRPGLGFPRRSLFEPKGGG